MKLMEPLYKGQRLSGSRNLDPDLKMRRARNDSRLKSIFESIFDKYGKDFDGIGDEIDLRTGEIVVDNGHLLSIRNETDTGHIDHLSKTLDREWSSDKEEVDEFQEDRTEGVTAHNGAVMLESETTLQALWVVDSLVEDARVGPPPASFGDSLHGQIEDYGSEEDELADKAVEWVTPREARAISYKKWQLPECGPTFTNDSIVEEAWRATPLPNSTPSRGAGQRTAPMRVDSSPTDKSSPSIWAPSRERGRSPEAPKPIERVAETLSQADPPVNLADSACSVKHDKGKILWTQEEEDRLHHLKTTTNLSVKKMEHLFPNRNSPSIAYKWYKMVHRDNSFTRSSHWKRRRTSFAPSVLKSTKDNNNNQPIRDQERQDFDVKVATSSGTADQISDNFFSELGGLLENSPDSSWLSDNCPTFTRSSDALTPASLSVKDRYSSTAVQCGNRLPYSSDGCKDDHPTNSRLNSPPGVASQQQTDHPKSSVDGQHKPLQEDLNGCRNDNTIQYSSTKTRRASDGIARHGQKVLKKTAAHDFEIVDQGSTSSVIGSGRPSTRDESPVKSTVVSSCGPRSLKSQPQKLRPSNAPHPVDSCHGSSTTMQHEKPLPQPTGHTAHEPNPSLSEIRRSARVPRRKRTALPTALEKRQNLQVVVAAPRLYSLPKSAVRSSPGTGEQTNVGTSYALGKLQQIAASATPSQPRESCSGSDEASRNKDVPLRAEIPDSQPTTSSPTSQINHDASGDIVVGQQRGLLSPAPTSPSRDFTRPGAINTKPDADLIDELSIITQLPKKRPRNRASSSTTNGQSPVHRTALTHRPRKRLKTKLSGSKFADSFSSGTTDLWDCSEDELSFM